MGGTYSTNGEMINAYNILIGKPKGRRPLWRRRHRWKVLWELELRKQIMKNWLGSSGLGEEPV